MTLGEVIKQYRESHELSMGQFAEISGISKAYVSLLEKNRHPTTGKPIVPTFQTIELASKAMGMDMNELIKKLDGFGSITLTSSERYYINPETAKIAQEVFDDPNLRLLFEASKDARPEDIKMAAELLKRFKESNPNG